MAAAAGATYMTGNPTETQQMVGGIPQEDVLQEPEEPSVSPEERVCRPEGQLLPTGRESGMACKRRRHR